MYLKGSLFVRHVITEGRTLYDNGFLTQLKKEPLRNSYADSLRELESIKKRLKLYEKPSIFKDLYVDCLSRVYRIFLEVVTVAVALKDEPIFNREKALTHFLRAYPSVAEDVQALESLRPFAMARMGVFKYRSESLPKLSLREIEEIIARLWEIIKVVESEHKFQVH